MAPPIQVEAPPKGSISVGVIMGFVFKHQEPGLFPAVDIDFYTNTAGIDLFGYFHIIQEAVLSLSASGYGGQIHQSHGFLLSSEFLPNAEVPGQSRLHQFPESSLGQTYLLNLCLECGMTAVVGPVGVKDSNFRFARVPLLCLCKIFLTVQDILFRHGQAHAPLETGWIIVVEVFKNRNIAGLRAEIEQ